MHLFNPGKRSRIFRDRPDLFGRLVERRNNRCPNDQLTLSRLGHAARVLKHQRVLPSGKLPVLLTVHMFDVHKIGVKIGKKHLDAGIVRASHTLQRSRKAGILGRMQQVAGKLGLKQALAARKGKPAQGPAVIDAVLLDRLHHLTDRGVLPDNFDLTVILPHLLNLVGLRFGVAAPAAAKHAPFQKNNGADSDPVMYRISLYIENSAFCV